MRPIGNSPLEESPFTQAGGGETRLLTVTYCPRWSAISVSCSEAFGLV
jgi:hypothetical protein